MEYRTENFLSPAAAAAAVAAHKPYHYLNQQSSPYTYNPYHSNSYVGGSTGQSASPPTNHSVFFGASPGSQYNSHSLASASSFSADFSRYAGKFSSGFSKFTPPGNTVASLYPGSGLATLVASGSSYTGNPDFSEDLSNISTSQSNSSLKDDESSRKSFDSIVTTKNRSIEKSPKQLQLSPELSADSPENSITDGKCLSVREI